MKGTYFQKPLEFNLLVEGEQWNQGDELSGILKVKNHGAEDMDLTKVGVQLGYAQAKKVKEKNTDCFDISDTSYFDEGQKLAAGSEAELNWKFNLGDDALISEKNASQYVLYGNEEGIWQGGQLQLNILPSPILQKYLEIFETFFRFKVKELKNKKGLIDAKLLPPTSRDFANIKALNIQMKYGETLTLNYHFKLKKIDYLENEMKMKEETQKLKYDLNSKEFMMYGKEVDQSKLESHIKSVLEEVMKSKKF